MQYSSNMIISWLEFGEDFGGDGNIYFLKNTIATDNEFLKDL